MEKMAKHYYEKEEYVIDAELYAKEVREVREKRINKYILLSRITNILELGCGSGVLKSLHPNWIGLDISSEALKRARPSNVIVDDARYMPIRDEAVDAIISFSTLEHIRDPERVLEECHRVLSPGGTILFHEAWFCECAHISHVSLYSKMGVVIRRIIRELKLFAVRKQMKLEFKEIEPDYTEIGKDWDSVSSIDPHSVLCWFESRGYLSLNKRKRMFQRCVRRDPSEDEEVVVLKKPSIS